MKYTYKPNGVCSREFIADIENGIIKSFEIVGGCPGNTQAVCKLIQGQKIEDVIAKLEGIDCRGRGTSCPDQVAVFLKSIKK